MFLSNGTTYRPGEGAERAAQLREGDLSEDILKIYVEDAQDSIRRYGPVPGATMDLFVADLIVRGIISHREVALALLNGGDKESR